MATIPALQLSEGMLLQGDGSSAAAASQAKPQKFYVVKSGKLDEIEDAAEFRAGGYNSNDVKIVSDAELQGLQFPPRPRLAPGGQIVLGLTRSWALVTA